MTTAVAARRIAILGNPNTGKTTLFNALTGHRARVGNYAGVTVERREGALPGLALPATLIDLPGTYSLSAHSPDELVAVRVLIGAFDGEAPPDAVVVVVDASNIERNLFLATQVLELGLPTLVVLNMADLAEADGIAIDVVALSQALGVPVVRTVAREKTGLDELRALLAEPAALTVPPAPKVYPDSVETEAQALVEAMQRLNVAPAWCSRFVATRLLVEADGHAERLLTAEHPELATTIAEARQRAKAAGVNLRTAEATGRYRWIRDVAGRAVSAPPEPSGDGDTAFSDRIDAILTHRLYGTLVFVVLMAVVFQSIYTWSGPLMDAIEGAVGALGGLVASGMAEGPLRSFLVDGVIAGVGGVVVFLPQIMVLFLFIALLEDIGYMARAAFLMDRLLSRCGLSGRSFIPMLSSFACAIPGVMAARTIEDPRDRLTTILVAPLMSCSARLPVYTLLIGAFIPAETVLGFLSLQGLVLFAMYLVGVLVAIPVALLLKATVLKAKTPPFLIELPPYRRPLLSTVFFRMAERGWEFIRRAGTMILAVSIVVWALTYYPRPTEVGAPFEQRIAAIEAEFETSMRTWHAVPGNPPSREVLDYARKHPERVATTFAPAAIQEGFALMDAHAEKVGAVEAERDGAYIRQSYLGRIGRLIEPVVEPLGWDWRIGMAAVASFPAREVIVATLGVIFDQGAAEDEESLAEKLRGATWPDGRPLMSIPVAVGLMVFFALCMQCAATLAIMRRETNGWRWPLFAFGYMTALAYVGAFVTYQLLSWVMGAGT